MLQATSCTLRRAVAPRVTPPGCGLPGTAASSPSVSSFTITCTGVRPALSLCIVG
ncbi:hypothetical protein DPMN_163432 [Dreissena polymorpha]|uniref:Uncharacterized protein n=1 Tax=Dreissena polymorpha TaxID=45954 RepID=A0A9D4IST4_DREPO|nr:hypothetical protein DPMN_163432 [Dreissena polymorpha]